MLREHSAMEIAKSRRILAVSSPDCDILKLLKDLTGSAPATSQGSNAGLSHTWNLETNYYKVEIPIWIDEIRNLTEWKSEFMGDEAKEVVQALGAWIYCFSKPVTQTDLDAIKDTLRAISEVKDNGSEYGWDGACVAVAMPQTVTPYLDISFDDWDDICRDFGFEFIDAEATGRNEYGEQTGIARIKEALQSNDWAMNESLDLDELEPYNENPMDEDSGFNMEGQEMGFEFAALKSALARDESSNDTEDDAHESDQVDELERMMVHLQAARETSSGLSGVDKRRFAAREVEKIMRQL
ncbi:hypothetical protein EV356DRAFT_224549 [Viridothelium virens]|uniref:Alpha and gamma adaptin binding protein p34 n=1 Tax=Viridothelium virens TaxID=1048519 RepID=A0A6A6HMB3_VIRVR|nr:hypothetical protein EV356DRAFT_224549 [Viridothelium virens]